MGFPPCGQKEARTNVKWPSLTRVAMWTETRFMKLNSAARRRGVLQKMPVDKRSKSLFVAQIIAGLKGLLVAFM